MDKKVSKIFIEIAITLVNFFLATGICYLLDYLKVNNLNFLIIYVLGVLLTALITRGFIYSSVYAIVSVLAYDFCFTDPRLTLHFHDKGYLVTFILMLLVGIIISAVMSQFKKKMNEIHKLNLEKQILKGDADKEKAKATLLRSISHDLRTPLTTMKNGSEILLEGNVSEDQKTEILTDIEAKANWTIRLVENLLSLSRINNEELSVKKNLEAVEEVVPEAVRNVQNQLGKREIHYEMPNDLMLVPMDATLIMQTIGNILINATKYTKEDGNIWIKVFNSGKNAVFRISNDGEPIKDEDIDHIFEMYYTDLNKNDKGHGLGLSICKLIITAHGGQISARNSKETNRVIFEFTLPMEDNSNGKHTNSRG